MSHYFTVPIGVLLCLTPSYAQEANTKSPVGTAEEERAESILRPVDVVLAVNEATINGDKDALLKLLSPIKDPRLKEQIERLNPEIGKRLATIMKNTSAIEGKEFGELAIVVKTDLGKQFTDGLDTDPLFLRKIDGRWKMIMAPSALEVAKELDAESLKSSFKKAISWYKENEPAIRKRLLKQQTRP